jgi:hypothetical protein
MFRDGSLPEKKQLLNLYLNKVTVYPEHVKIVFNHVPQNLIPFASQSQVRPADEGEPCDVHKLIISAKIKEAPTPKLEWTRFPLVEATRVELVSEIVSTGASPGAVLVLKFPPYNAQGQAL